MGEILQSRNQQPIFFICSPRCKSETSDRRGYISKDGNDTPVSIFSYDDPNYIIDKNSLYTFSDYSSYEAHLEEVSLVSASLFDKDRFSLYIKENIIKEIKNVVLYEVPRVFISHSHLDNDVADEIYTSLSRSGVKCWMDLKDIPAGASYSDAIIQGLEWCNCLVLIYSKNVIGSVDIPNELEVAHTDHKTIIPFLIDDSPIEGGYRYYLPRKQWIDASQQRHIAIEKLKSELFRNTPERIINSERLDINHSDSTTPVSVAPVHIKKDGKYDVFLSAKSEDYNWASEIYDFLSSKGVTVFFAHKEIKRMGEAKYSEEIDEVLDNCTHMIVVASSMEHLKSKWVKHEWGIFSNDLKSGYKDGNLLTIIGEDIHKKDLPASLRHQLCFSISDYKHEILDYLLV